MPFHSLQPDDPPEIDFLDALVSAEPVEAEEETEAVKLAVATA